MTSFRRTKRESRLLGVFGLVISFVLSMLFMLVGFHRFGESNFSAELIFGIVGVALFILFFRLAWTMTGGGLVHVFSIDSQKVTWGFLGKEKELDTSKIRRIYWNEADGFTLEFSMSGGDQVRFPCIENVVSPKSRPELRRAFQILLPEVDVDPG